MFYEQTIISTIKQSQFLFIVINVYVTMSFIANYSLAQFHNPPIVVINHSLDQNISPDQVYDYFFSLSDCMSDEEMNFITNPFKMVLPEGLDSVRLLNLRLRGVIELESDFVKFNFLRSLAKHFTLVWYDEEKEKEFAKSSSKRYVCNDAHKYTHNVNNTDEIERWKTSLCRAILRYFHASNSGVAFGYGINQPIPPHGIVFDTDKEKVFVGITQFGFHLGKWNSNQFDQRKLFFSPELALCLQDYVKKHKLQHFPKIEVDVLSGKFFIQSQYNAYQYRKQEETKTINGDNE
jgi:hypothetical protein